MRRQHFNRIIGIITGIAVFVSGVYPVQAQSLAVMPSPGVRVSMSAAFQPAELKGIKIYPDNPFRFDFILDQGDNFQEQASLKEESNRLIRYFLAALTVPAHDMWVNLSPYEKNRIIPQAFGQTAMGRDLLAQDYLLKQVTASAIYPEDLLGQQFWTEVYKRAWQDYGTTDIPLETFNKVWIIPDKAVVYENAAAGTAWIVESHLKVLLESDYQLLSESVVRDEEVKSVASQELLQEVIRDIVLPMIEKEVNEGKNFSVLRQLYQSLIMASWYKKKVKDGLLSQVYVDQRKVQGVNIADPAAAEKIWEQYVVAFKKGAYSYIKEEQEEASGDMIPRKYFSGGVDWSMAGDVLDIRSDVAMSSAGLKQAALRSLIFLTVALQGVGGVAESERGVVISGNDDKGDGQQLYIETNSKSFRFADEGGLMGPTQMFILDTKSGKTIVTLDYGHSFMYAENNQDIVIEASDPDLQRRLVNIFGADVLSRGVHKDIVNRVLFWSNTEGDALAKKALTYLQTLLGDEVYLREDIFNAFGLDTLKDGQRFKALWQKASDFFGESVVNQPGGVKLFDFVEGETIKGFQDIVSTLHTHFEGHISPTLLLDVGESLKTHDTAVFVDFFKRMSSDMSHELAMYLLAHGNRLVRIIERHGKDLDNIFSTFRILAEEYYITDPKELVSIIYVQPSLAMLPVLHDMGALRVGLNKILGEAQTQKLLPLHDIKALDGMQYLRAGFFKDPEGYIKELNLPLDMLQALFQSWRAVGATFIWHAQFSHVYKHPVETLWQKAREKLGQELLDYFFQRDIDTVFRLLWIMDQNGFDVINSTFSKTMSNLSNLYTSSDARFFLEKLKTLPSVDTDDTYESVVRANAQLRDYFLNALFYMVSSGMLTSKELPKEKLQAMVLRIIIDTQPVRGMDNAFSSGEFGMDLVKRLKADPSLVLGVVAHEIAHQLFGFSEGAADIWAFGFLSKIGYGKDVGRMQASLKYEKADAQTGEVHDVGRAMVKSLMSAIKIFADSQEVDWARVSLSMRDKHTRSSFGVELGFLAFSSYVQEGLNDAQRQLMEEKAKGAFWSEDLPDIARQVKALGDKASVTVDWAQQAFAKNLGGIDFNDARLDLIIQNAGAAITYTFDSELVQALQGALGLTPLIIDFHPLESLPHFWGVDPVLL